MEFADVGVHCFYDLCGQQSFLPFECQSCHHSFCKLHAKPEAHLCTHSGIQKAGSEHKEIEQIERGGKSEITMHECHHAKCAKREFIKIECNQCLQTFCLKHRFPDNHDCKAPVKQRGGLLERWKNKWKSKYDRVKLKMKVAF